MTDLDLVAAPLVEVAHERHEQPVAETLGAHLGLHLAAVLAEESPLLLHDLAGSDDGQRFDQPRLLAQGQDIGDCFAHELSRLVAEQAVTARVHLDETTLVRRDEDSVRRPLDQHPKRLIGQTAGMARLIERHHAPLVAIVAWAETAYNRARDLRLPTSARFHEDPPQSPGDLLAEVIDIEAHRYRSDTAAELSAAQVMHNAGEAVLACGGFRGGERSEGDLRDAQVSSYVPTGNDG